MSEKENTPAAEVKIDKIIVPKPKKKAAPALPETSLELNIRTLVKQENRLLDTIKNKQAELKKVRAKLRIYEKAKKDIDAISNGVCKK